MTKIVPAEDIERIVGRPRHGVLHYARAVSREQQVYILHSRACLDTYPDLRQCPWSLALDNGIHVDQWIEDVPLAVGVVDERLVPITPQPDDADVPDSRSPANVASEATATAATTRPIATRVGPAAADLHAPGSSVASSNARTVPQSASTPSTDTCTGQNAATAAAIDSSRASTRYEADDTAPEGTA